jgi:asparagine synthase (glutamine-hydrolysing)
VLEWPDFVEYEGISPLVQQLLENTTRRIIDEHKSERIGIGISGGVDSTTVLALARKCFPDLKLRSYCITFGSDTKESEDALHVSRLYFTEHKDINVENPFSELEDQVRIVDEPRWNLYPYFLFREAAKDCDVILTGDGGDELFGGYVFRYADVLNSGEVSARSYLDAHARDWVPDQKELFAIPFDWSDIYRLLTPYFSNPLPALGKVFLADYNGKLLYDFAPTNAALSKHFGIAVEAPFLEPEVMHVATHLPYGLKYDPLNNLGKVILRQILLENSAYKPATKGKVGWGMDIAEMWDTRLRSMCEDLFESPRFVQLGIINNSWLERGFKRSDEHDLRYVSKMLGLLALELWLKYAKLVH